MSWNMEVFMRFLLLLHLETSCPNFKAIDLSLHHEWWALTFLALFSFCIRSICIKIYTDKQTIHTNRTMIRQHISISIDEQYLCVNLVYDQRRCTCMFGYRYTLFDSFFQRSHRQSIVVLYDQPKHLAFALLFVYKSHVYVVISANTHRSLIYLNIARNAKERAYASTTTLARSAHTHTQHIYIFLYRYISTLWLFVPFRAQRSI